VAQPLRRAQVLSLQQQGLVPLRGQELVPPELALVPAVLFSASKRSAAQYLPGERSE